MKPFLHGRKTLSVPALRPPGAPAPAALRPTEAGAASVTHLPSATVEVVKEGDKVSRLVVTCACGEKIEIDCIYPAGV